MAAPKRVRKRRSLTRRPTSGPRRATTACTRRRSCRCASTLRTCRSSKGSRPGTFRRSAMAEAEPANHRTSPEPRGSSGGSTCRACPPSPCPAPIEAGVSSAPAPQLLRSWLTRKRPGTFRSPEAETVWPAKGLLSFTRMAVRNSRFGAMPAPPSPTWLKRECTVRSQAASLTDRSVVAPHSGSGNSFGVDSRLVKDVPVRSAGKPLGEESKQLLRSLEFVRLGDASTSAQDDFELWRLEKPSNRLDPFLGDAASSSFEPNRVMPPGLASVAGGGCKSGESSSTCSTRTSPSSSRMYERWPGGTGRWSRCIAMIVAWYSVGKSMSATIRPTSQDCSFTVPRSTARPRLFDTCIPVVVSSRVRMTVETSSIFSANAFTPVDSSTSQRQMEIDR
mmetsp:Transcript_84290/g.233624  ORF Transcript_84290/g.233624 Transcript_84290/m.233624 type:complete len:392 (-) Transcript_84290:1457-2632(-)